MKNKLKLFGIIVFIAVIGFAVIACDDGINPDGINPDDLNPDGINPDDLNPDDLNPDVDVMGATLRLFDKPVTVYPWKNDECTATNFVYWDNNEPLSDYISGTPEVSIIDGKLTIKLDAPKPEAMLTLSDFFEDAFMGIDIFNSGLTAAPSVDEVLCLGIYNFFESEGNCYLEFKNDDTVGRIYLIYVDKTITIDGTTVGSEPFEDTFDNVILYQGWNYLIGIVDDDQNYNFTSTRSEPSGYNWTLY